MSETPITPENDTAKRPFSSLTFAYLLLRLWLGLLLVTSGLSKFKVRGEQSYSIEALHGWVNAAGTLIWENTFMTEWMVKGYMYALGPVMILAGIMILLGVLNRIALFIGGAIFVSLSVGMMLLPDQKETLYLGLHLALFVGALCLVRFNRVAITKY